MKVKIGDLKPEANFLISRIAGRTNLFFDNPASPQSANEHSITWFKKSKVIQDKIRSTKSSFVVIKEKADLEPEETANKVILFSKNPNLTFGRICRKFFEQRKPPFIHQSTILSKEASVHSSTGIGPNSVIGKSTIGANCEIWTNTIIGDEVTIGENVIINYGAVLGSQGYGYYKNQENRPWNDFFVPFLRFVRHEITWARQFVHFPIIQRQKARLCRGHDYSGNSSRLSECEQRSGGIPDYLQKKRRSRCFRRCKNIRSQELNLQKIIKQ